MAERTYVASYWFAGSRYSCEVVASSWDEAQQKLGAMALGQIDGVLVAKIPAGGRRLRSYLRVAILLVSLTGLLWLAVGLQ